MASPEQRRLVSADSHWIEAPGWWKGRIPREFEKLAPQIGKDVDGGVYTLKVSAKNGTNTVTSQVLTRGQVTGVEMYDGAPYLNVGNSIVPLSTVFALKQHTAAAA